MLNSGAARWLGALSLTLGLAAAAWAQPGEAPNLGARLTQEMVESDLSARELRAEGRRIFSTPFNRLDGLGDGPIDSADPTSLGGRPTLQNNGMFLRMNGLDSQTCLECHSVLSNAEIPATFAVGGVGGIAATALPGVVRPDVEDAAGNGFAAISGRMINPPFSFGAGGVELLGREMTGELQALAALAEANPGREVELSTKGVSFGSVVFENGGLDTTNVEGIDADLVVRPFGRKGCCATVRGFDVGAMQFHMGIQPVEVVGAGVDADGDGVADELTVGELSAVHFFQASLPPPRRLRDTPAARRGEALFEEIGCADCHVPSLRTERRTLDLSFPEVPTDPRANVYRSVELDRRATRFPRDGRGIRVELYADLKRHQMGDDLEESTGGSLDAHFTTARLWGVADTAPYLHDGRASTLTEAILFHGGEAEPAKGRFDALRDGEREDLLGFLRSLRTPDALDLEPDHDHHHDRHGGRSGRR